MRKFATIGMGIISLAGFAGAASAADLAPRVHAKAPPMIAAIYHRSGFYIGLDGGGASSHNCLTITNSEGCHDATAAWSVVSSVIAGRPAAAS